MIEPRTVIMRAKERKGDVLFQFLSSFSMFG